MQSTGLVSSTLSREDTDQEQLVQPGGQCFWKGVPERAEGGGAMRKEALAGLAG